jgi:hypothetical protein
MSTRLLRPSPRPLASALLLAAAIAGAVAAPGAAAASTPADTSAIAWSVATVDGENGSDRPNFTYADDPGGVQRDALRVTNTGTSPLELALYAADAYTTPTGNIDLNTLDAPSTGAGTWIALESDTLSLRPGESADVAFRIEIPTDAVPGDHSAGIVTSLRSHGSGALSVDRRLATRVSVRVSGELSPAVAVEGLTAAYEGSWNPFAAGTLRIDYRLANTGNTRVTAVDQVHSGGPFGMFARPAASAELPEVLPGSTVEVHHEFETTPWGLLTGTVTVQPLAVGLGAQPVAVVVLPYEAVAVPWALLAVLILVAAIVVAVVVRARRRARAGATAGAAQTTDAAAAPQ